jgi:hypothetical protein
MRRGKSGCQKPDQLRDRPEKCSPKQIAKCHGDARRHACVKPTRTK